MKVVRESEKLLQLPRICRFGKSRDPIQLGTCEMASVLTDSVPEILYLGKANPTLLWVELNVRALAANMHLTVVVEELFLSLTKVFLLAPAPAQKRRRKGSC